MTVQAVVHVDKDKCMYNIETVNVFIKLRGVSSTSEKLNIKLNNSFNLI